MDLLQDFVEKWLELSVLWKSERSDESPLALPSAKVVTLESAFVRVAVDLLTAGDEEYDERLFA